MVEESCFLTNTGTWTDQAIGLDSWVMNALIKGVCSPNIYISSEVIPYNSHSCR